MSAFRDHVCGVLLRSPEEEVSRVTARRVVALVADDQPFWDVAVCKAPGHPRRDLRGFASPDAKLPVTLASACPCPWPAVVRPRLVHLFPEALLNGLAKSGHPMR